MLGSLAGAAIVVGLLWRGNPHPGWFIPGAGKYELKNSWISNTTVFAAILGTPLKDIAGIPLPTLASLNVLFLAVAGIAVLLQAATVRVVGNGFCTPVWAFLITGVLSLCAAIGQLATLFYIACAAADPLRDPPPVLTQFGGWILEGAAVVAGGAVLFFAWRAMRGLLKLADKACQPAAAMPLAAAPARANDWAIL
jgi:hypothetical protein